MLVQSQAGFDQPVSGHRRAVSGHRREGEAFIRFSVDQQSASVRPNVNTLPVPVEAGLQWVMAGNDLSASVSVGVSDWNFTAHDCSKCPLAGRIQTLR